MTQKILFTALSAALILILLSSNVQAEHQIFLPMIADQSGPAYTYEGCYSCVGTFSTGPDKKDFVIELGDDNYVAVWSFGSINVEGSYTAVPVTNGFEFHTNILVGDVTSNPYVNPEDEWSFYGGGGMLFTGFPIHDTYECPPVSDPHPLAQ